MPTFVRHKTGSVHTDGFWTGSDTDVFADNCSTTDKTAIQNAFNTFSKNPGLNCFPAMRDAMISTFATIPIDCCFDNTRPPRGGDLEALIFVCNMTDRQIQVELCKGLALAVAAGDVLDARAMVFSCFGAPDGVPNVADFNVMVADPQLGNNANERLGHFVVWNRSTGEVFNQTTVQTSGFWTGGTAPAKGNRCFVDAAWVF
jgi:hypothetical protein